MSMNTYKHAISEVFKWKGLGDIEKLDKKTVYQKLLDYCEPAELAPIFQALRPGTDSQVANRMVADTTTIFLLEAFSLFYGVVIHVEDKALVEALIRTKVDAVVGDVRLPFPIMEFTFPEGIKFGGEYELNGALMVDLDQFGVQKELNRRGLDIGKVDARGRPLANIAVLSRVRKNGAEDEDVCIHRFCHDMVIMEGDETYLPKDEAAYIQHIAVFLLSLLLYVQCYEKKEEVLQPRENSIRMPHGVPANMASLARKRKSYQIHDLLGMGRAYVQEEHTNGGGTHASPKPHWRTWTLRSLRHEKFKRKADGSIRIIMVKPCMVGVKDEDDHVRGERKISPPAEINTSNDLQANSGTGAG